MKLIATLLFIVLSPGLLLTLPPVGKEIFMSLKTSILAILTHAVLFFILLYFFEDATEGFENPSKPVCGTTSKATGCECSVYVQCKSGKCTNGHCE